MQQINLYQSVFQQQRLPLSTKHLLSICMTVFVLLGIVSVYSVWQSSRLETELETTQTQDDALTAELDKLQKQQDARGKDTRIIQQIEQLTAAISSRQQVLKVLSGQSFGNTKGFVEHIKGLARQRIEEVWLTGLSISQGGGVVGMQGQALQPEAVPRYLQRLSAEAAFAGKEFKTLHISRNEKNESRIDFDLQGVGADEHKAEKSQHAVDVIGMKGP